MKYYGIIIPQLEAEEELRYRAMQGSLTPDRYYTLLIQIGISEKEADSLRANLLMEQAQRASTWQK